MRAIPLKDAIDQAAFGRSPAGLGPLLKRLCGWRDGRGGLIPYMRPQCRRATSAAAVPEGDQRRIEAMAGDLAVSDATHAGQAVYSPFTLKIYDLLVLGLSNSFIWTCPTREILRLYDQHVAAAHLDVGVGTGWYLDHCRFPSPAPRVGLLDLNANSLTAAARRIARYRPAQYRADVLQPIAIEAEPFGSIAATYLLHCLPGTIEEKAVVFDHLIPLLAPSGTLFGATLLASGVPVSGVARKLMGVYNRKGIFCNEADHLNGLQTALSARFGHVEVRPVGCGALFAARAPIARTTKALA